MASSLEPPAKSGYPNRWEARWQEKNTKWDQGHAHPALVRLLQERGEALGIPTAGKALVPGCGSGYDVLLFAQRGLQAKGLDIAPTGVQAARSWLQEHASGEDDWEIIQTDFFAFSPDYGFDLILDYTFLCALPPELRRDWSDAITRLATKSSETRLITIMYPLGRPKDERGPPWPLEEETYQELLGVNWKLIHVEELRDGEQRTIGAPGGEKVGVWQLREIM